MNTTTMIDNNCDVQYFEWWKYSGRYRIVDADVGVQIKCDQMKMWPN